MNVHPEDILRGESFQELAGVFLGRASDFTYNPRIARIRSKCLSVDQIPVSWNNPAIIFCYGHVLETFSKQYSSRITKHCIVLSGNSDENISWEHVRELVDNPWVIKIYAQNLMVRHDKLFVLPIGLANRHWSHGNEQPLYKIDRTKTDKVFCSVNFSHNSRNDFVRAVQSLNVSNQQRLKHPDFIQKLARAQFSLCPRGNGLDTHRFWESLYVGTVPIVQADSFTEMVADQLKVPMILVDSWENLKLDTYTAEPIDTRVLSMKHWKETFENDLRSVQISVETVMETSMHVVVSFIGTMPSYIVECLTQLRMFYDGPICVIYSYVSDALKHSVDALANIEWIPYNSLRCQRFDQVAKRIKFDIVKNLQGREELFLRSFERLYLLYNLMYQKNLKHVWFMELDILMYVDPRTFLQELSQKPYAYCYHDKSHCSTAIFYARTFSDLDPILASLDKYEDKEFKSEMRAMSQYLKKNPHDTLFPLLTPCTENEFTWKDSKLFGPYIFDGAVIGQYLGGVDPIHTGNKIVRRENKHLQHLTPVWNYGTFEWIRDDQQRWIPILKHSDKVTYIANLHMHSKDLSNFMSNRPSIDV